MKSFVYLQPSQIQYLGSHSLPCTPSTNEDSDINKENQSKIQYNLSKSVILLVNDENINALGQTNNLSPNKGPPINRIPNLGNKSGTGTKEIKSALPASKVKSWLTSSIEQLCSINIKRQETRQSGIVSTNHLPNLEHHKFSKYGAQAPLRLQVVQRNGSWFAINGASLSLLQGMEKCGSLKRVKAEVISHKLVPPDLFRDHNDSLNKVAPNSCKETSSGAATGFTYVRAFIMDSITSNKKRKSISTNITQHQLKSLPNSNAKENASITPHKGEIDLTNKPCRERDAAHKEETRSIVSEEYCFDSLSDNTDYSTGASDGNDSESYASSDDDNDSWEEYEEQRYDQGSSTEESEVYDYGCDEKKIKEYPCYVCHYRFRCQRDVLRHQKDLKHFMCLICDMILPTLKQYQAHKTVLNHWSDTEGHDIFDSVQEIGQGKEHKLYLKHRKVPQKTKITI